MHTHVNSTNVPTNGTQVLPNGISAVSFMPLLAPNVLFAIVFGILLGIQLLVAARFRRYYGNAIGMLGGLLLELLGYIAKVMLAHDQVNKNGYIMYIIGLTLGPTFLSSALYLSISALMRAYPAAKLRYVGSRIFSTLFILGDFICLSFIGIGGSCAAIFPENPVGVDLMIAGLGTQILFTAIFCGVLVVLYRRIHHIGRRIMHYGAMLGTAAACLFIRSCWRAAELSGGFNGPLASMEGAFIALDSIPMIIMSVLLIVLHPGFWFSSTDTAVQRAKRSALSANKIGEV